MNSVNLVGRIATDIELRYSKGGRAVCYFVLAVDKPYRAQYDDDDTVFPRVVMFGPLADNVAKYKRKGDLIAVSGWLSTRSYETEDGETRYVTEVVAEDVKFLDWRERDDEDDDKKKDRKKGKSVKTKR